MVFETMVYLALKHLVGPLAREKFIAFSRHESCKLYTVQIKAKIQVFRHMTLCGRDGVC